MTGSSRALLLRVSISEMHFGAEAPGGFPRPLAYLLIEPVRLATLLRSEPGGHMPTLRVLALCAVFAGPALADPGIEARPLATAPAVPVPASPSEGFAARVGSALKAVRTPQGIPPAASTLAAPLASRVGKDV